MPNEPMIRNVADELSEKQLQNPEFPFLGVQPALVRVLMFQPQDLVFGDETRVGVHDRTRLIQQTNSFLHNARELNADLILCPEYSCPWASLVEAINTDVFPANGKLWALACESATPDELNSVFAQVSTNAAIVFDEGVFASGGNFVDPLCYLFRTRRTDGTATKVLLVQPKTCPMGGIPFELQHLKTGVKLYRFRNSTEQSNSLVGLICSDTLHPKFNELIVPQLLSNTLVLHPQMNMSPESQAFRLYRNSCCSISPRSTEILCLNWAKGTQLLDHHGKVLPFIDEPKSMLFRDTQQLTTEDERVMHNHARGCYLTNWHESRTAAFIFSPDPHLFYFETSKPFVSGPAQTAIRIGPQMVDLLAWDNAGAIWKSVQADDRFKSHWLDSNPSLQGLLGPLLPQHMVAERLIQLSTGHAKDLAWPDWKELPSFRLADDDTPRRLTLCWSHSGAGPEFREKCLGRFLGFVAVISDSKNFSNRLHPFKEAATFEVALKPKILAKRLRNLHLPDGRSATAIYMGERPGNHSLMEVKDRTQAALAQTESDDQLLAVWYRDPNGALHDFMDLDIPQINGDPGNNPVGITS
jgi:hypothetical protein